MIRNTLDILDPRLVKVANDIFRLEFTQGLLCNDD